MKGKAILIFLVLFVFAMSFASVAVSAASREIGIEYHTRDQVYSILKGLAAAHPDEMTYEVIGKSIQGRDILMFKVGNPNGGKFMFDGLLHGSEDCGTENGIQFIKWVLESSDPDAVSVRKNNYLLFIPIINIDSTGARQNMRRNYTYQNGTFIKIPYGVDLNRNFPTDWGSMGSKNPLNDFEYMGPIPGSEPETQAVLNAMKKFKPNIYMNVHCGMQMLGYRTKNNVTLKVISLINNISARTGANTLSLYPPSYACSGGMSCYDGAYWSGGNGWLYETCPWSALPDTLEGYLQKWYPQAFPIYLAMAKTVQTSSSTAPISPFCDDKVCNGVETCSTCKTDCGACPVVNDNIMGCRFEDKTWNQDKSLNSAYDLNTCFKGIWAEPIDKFRAIGNNSIKVSIINGFVNLASPAGWSGSEEVRFFAFSQNRSAYTNPITLTVLPITVKCGDKVCNGKENCTTCSSDCGSCPVINNNNTNIMGCGFEDITWYQDESLNSAYDLNTCFKGIWAEPIDKFRAIGNNSIDVSIINGFVNLASPAGWSGSEEVRFFAYSKGRSAYTNPITLTVLPVKCGDGVCQSKETCDSCSSDCGSCPEPKPRHTGGGGGGGGGGGSYYKPPEPVPELAPLPNITQEPEPVVNETKIVEEQVIVPENVVEDTSTQEQVLQNYNEDAAKNEQPESSIQLPEEPTGMTIADSKGHSNEKATVGLLVMASICTVMIFYYKRKILVLN